MPSDRWRHRLVGSKILHNVSRVFMTVLRLWHRSITDLSMIGCSISRLVPLPHIFQLSCIWFYRRYLRYVLMLYLCSIQIQKFPGYPQVPLNATQITRSLEAYILWLLGKVMFTENHVTTISALYIPIALEIARAQTPAQITQRSWGSMVLAATYRGMCNACQLTAPTSALLGCPLFLQLWSWERFSIGRPDIRIHEPMPVMFDAEGIDMPSFGLCWTRRKVCLVL